MDIFIVLIQLVVGLGILNVWLLRFTKASQYRGGDATNMVEEFRVYGLPEWSVYVIGSLKVLFAVLILSGIFAPLLVAIGATGLGFLMLGAVVMHIKVGDPAIKSLPAVTLLVLCVVLVLVG